MNRYSYYPPLGTYRIIQIFAAFPSEVPDRDFFCFYWNMLLKSDKVMALFILIYSAAHGCWVEAKFSFRLKTQDMFFALWTRFFCTWLFNKMVFDNLIIINSIQRQTNGVFCKHLWFEASFIQIYLICKGYLSKMGGLLKTGRLTGGMSDLRKNRY